MAKACYRELQNYKYQLMDDHVYQTDIRPEQSIDYKFMSLDVDGLLTVRKAYAWDGPSGIAIDTKNFMRGSLVHDVLYQMMRLNALDYKVHRKRTDEMLREICLEDGMSSFRAWYVYRAVRWFGEANATPNNDPEVETICAP